MGRCSCPLLIASLLTLPLASVAGDDPPALPALAESDWAAFSYSPGEGDCTKAFVLRARVQAGGPARVRVAFNVVDERNHYALDLSQSGARLLRVESGLEIAIGHGSDATLSPGRQSWLTIARDARLIIARLDGRLIAQASDSAFVGGGYATGCAFGAVAFSDVEMQPDAPVHFDDNFMRADGEGNDWQTLSGTWELKAIENALRSSNGFNYHCQPSTEPSVATVGYWFWDNYEAGVAVQPHGEGEVGLLVHCADLLNHYRAVWRCVDGATGDGRLELVKVVGDRSEVLAAAEGGYHPGQWYALSLAVDHGRLRVSIDGTRVLEAWDEALSGGRVGLWARGPAGCTFDDLRVHESRVHPLHLAHLTQWQAIGGSWRGQWLPAGPETGRCLARSEAPARLLSHSMPPSNLKVSATARVRAKEAGLCAGYQDEDNFYLLSYRASERALVLTRVLAGTVTELGRAPYTEGNLMELSLSHCDGQLCGRAGETARIDAWDAALGDGAVGLYISGGQVEFQSVEVERIAPLPPIRTDAGAFAHEESMAAWSEGSSDWFTMAPDSGLPVQWHLANVPGDCDMSLDVSAPPAGPVSLAVAAAEPVTALGGYALTVTPGVEGQAQVLRDGAAVASVFLPNLAPESVTSLRLTRAGAAVGGYLNGTPLLSYTDPEPLTGYRVGWSAPQGAVDVERVRVNSAHVIHDNFREAPAAWRPVCGQWRVTNRWDCDPRWSFFSGASDDLACLWHKSAFGEDVSVEFHGAVQFDSSRGTPAYEWARDINCTIAADGRDLTSGYSFVFGGWDDTYTRLLRGNEVVAETSDTLIPRASSIHTQWFHLRMDKTGDRIRCWLDGTLLFDYTDPEPLTGKHLALWTYADGVAIAQVRIASDSITPPSFPPAPSVRPRCCYDAEVAP